MLGWRLLSWFKNMTSKSPKSPGATRGASSAFVDVDMEERYVASMVLSGVGDALGYKNGRWEFCHSGREIHKELEGMGGLESVKCCLPKWKISDDTVMHLATGEALAKHGLDPEKEVLYSKIASHYKECMHDMAGRAPGMTCMNWAGRLKPKKEKGYCIPFNKSGGGCGAAMRAMCIGLRYPRVVDLDDLIAVSVEAGRMTHHHPTGYLGSLAAALFVSYAIQDKPVQEWGCGLMSTLKKAKDYVKERGAFVEENMEAWGYFTDSWMKYLTTRNILDGKSEPIFPAKYDIEERDEFYRSVSYSGWGGASGHDAPMIAYDAVLGAGPSWTELCSRSMFHCGDSDSTGVIAAACYGAMYGFQGVPERNYENVEYRERLTSVGKAMYEPGTFQDKNPRDQTIDEQCESQDTETDDSQSLSPRADKQIDSQSTEISDEKSSQSQVTENQSDSQGTEIDSENSQPLYSGAEILNEQSRDTEVESQPACDPDRIAEGYSPSQTSPPREDDKAESEKTKCDRT